MIKLNFIFFKNNEKTRENNIKIALNEKCVFLRFNPDKKKIKIETKQKVLKSYIDYYINKNKSDNDVVYFIKVYNQLLET